MLYEGPLTAPKRTLKRVYEGPLIAEAVEELRILKMLIFRPEAVILKSAFRWRHMGSYEDPDEDFKYFAIPSYLLEWISLKWL